MRKILDYFLCMIAFFIGVIVFFQFDVEEIMWGKNLQPAVSTQEIEENVTVDFRGKPAGEGVMRLSSIDDWQDALNDIDYVTVQPKSIQKTNVYSLAKWVGYFTKRSNGTSGRRLEEVKKASFDLDLKYIPYYIIELPDGNRVLAQMNRSIARAIKQGKEITLPLGLKQGFLPEAKELLGPVCESLNVPTDYVLYTIDNEWQAKHADIIFYIKLATAIAVTIVLAVILMFLADIAISRIKKDSK
jgi:hypothetical protein